LPLPAAPSSAETAAPPAIDTPAAPAEEALASAIEFKKGKSELSADARARIDVLARDVRQKKTATIRVVGYASGTAEESSIARKISLARALVIRAALIDKGVPAMQVSTQAFGNKVDADKAEIYVK
jgi:outer membrane protein OmpA-like peptidoglycan-associated protein